MKNRKMLMMIGSLLLATIAQQEASAASTYMDPTQYRCTYDQLTDSNSAKARRQWAQTWANNDPYDISTSKDRKFWDSSYSEEAATMAEQGVQLYPVYVDPNNNWNPYKLPSTITYTPLTDYKVKPVQVMMDGLCAPGCYEASQMVLFGDEELPISEAFARKEKVVTTLTPSSTLHRLSFMENRVGAYITDIVEAEQTLLVFTTDSGLQLKVTENHPIVAEDGTMREARAFLVGDGVITETGEIDPIVSIESVAYFGKTYNLKPVTRDYRSNILVAEGILNGSLRFQQEYVEELNRVILRSNLPEELLRR